MEVKARLKFLRMSPRKVRTVADVIRGKRVDVALGMLPFIYKRAAKPVEKLVRSAVANAEHNYNVDVDSLYIKSVYVDPGPTLKRYRPRAMGRVGRIRRRTCHITVILDEMVK